MSEGTGFHRAYRYRLRSNRKAEAVLRRWAGRFSPLVAEEPSAGLMIDLTGCAHLFGGEAGVMAALEGDCADLGLTVSAAIADTPGAAWAVTVETR